MLQIFRMGEYWICFWTNENKPVEPIHVHIAKGKTSENATKVWITSAGKYWTALGYVMGSSITNKCGFSYLVVIWYEVMNHVEYLEGSGQMMFRSFSYGQERQ